jgi:hypothetical protein
MATAVAAKETMVLEKLGEKELHGMDDSFLVNGAVNDVLQNYGRNTK